MLATQLKPLVEDHTLDKNMVVRITQYTANTVQNRKILILLNLEVLSPALDHRIGNPQNIEAVQAGGAQGGAAAPAAAPAPVGGSNFASPLSYLSSTTMAPRADATDLPGVRKAQDPTQGDTYGTTSGRPPVVIGSPTSASTGSAPSAAPTESAAPASAPKPAAASASPPPSYPPTESAPSSQVRAPSPALPDDVGPVRQLCQMGFSRTQVVRALERCGYRTERALEHLLSNSGRA